MVLILIFVALAVIGQAANLAIAIAIENVVSPAASIPVFFVLLLTVFWAAWRLALWFTERTAVARERRHQQRHEAHA
jgi:hypothetical protein